MYDSFSILNNIFMVAYIEKIIQFNLSRTLCNVITDTIRLGKKNN